MKVNYERKLDFSDVNIEPISTEISSRSMVNLKVSYICKHSRAAITGLPVIVSNMAGIGTIRIAEILSNPELDAFVCLCKHHQNFDHLVKFFNTNNSKNTFYTVGIANNGEGEEFARFKDLKSKTNNLNKLCLDVANGYMYSFLDVIKQYRSAFPDLIIMAGNVATPEGVENIIKAGADIAKCGIANGCFVAGTRVKTNNGYRNIEEICLGDKVLTRTGEYRKVVQLHQRFEDDELICVNSAKCTLNHMFYVRDFEGCFDWVAAGDLDPKSHSLVRLIEAGKYEFVPINYLETEDATSVPVYDLGVEGEHSYCVMNNIVVHNSFCDTKNKAGVCCKQFSVAMECGQAANELNALCCSDGGCKTPADFGKALGAGSHFVMAGGIFGGCEETEEEWQVDENGDKVAVRFYGMSSRYANDKFCGGLKKYRASEGKEGWLPYKGNIADIILDIRGSLVSSCAYTNTRNLENLWKNCKFFT